MTMRPPLSVNTPFVAAVRSPTTGGLVAVPSLATQGRATLLMRSQGEGTATDGTIEEGEDTIAVDDVDECDTDKSEVVDVAAML